MAYYTSAHPALMSPKCEDRTTVRPHDGDLARSACTTKATFPASILDIAERLCLVEHVDHDRFRRENRSAIYDDVFALYR